MQAEYTVSLALQGRSDSTVLSQSSHFRVDQTALSQSSNCVSNVGPPHKHYDVWWVHRAYFCQHSATAQCTVDKNPFVAGLPQQVLPLFMWKTSTMHLVLIHYGIGNTGLFQDGFLQCCLDKASIFFDPALYTVVLHCFALLGSGHKTTMF